MSTATQHTMMRTGSTESGAEEWRCPHCGRRLLLQWRPFGRVVLDPGDERVQHVGAKGGASIETAGIGLPGPTNNDARWLAANGLAWHGADQESRDQ
jgi:DNA-directed RNA polymerase subunit RPC12/RpoP